MPDTVKKTNKRKASYDIYKRVKKFIQDPNNTWINNEFKKNLKKWNEKGSTFVYWYNTLQGLINRKIEKQAVKSVTELYKNPENLPKNWEKQFNKDYSEVQNLINNETDESKKITVDLTEIHDPSVYTMYLLQSLNFPLESEKLIKITTKYVNQKGIVGEFTKVVTQPFLLGLIDQYKEDKGNYYDESYRPLIRQIRTGLSLSFHVVINKNNTRKKKDGAYFPYKHILDFDLSMLQIYKNAPKNDYIKKEENKEEKEEKEEKHEDIKINDLNEEITKISEKISKTKDKKMIKKLREEYKILCKKQEKYVESWEKSLKKDNKNTKFIHKNMKTEEKNYDDGSLNCFVHCCKYYNFSENECERAKSLIINGSISLTNLETFAKEINKGFDVYEYTPKCKKNTFKLRKINKKAKKRYRIGFVLSHYFPDIDLKITTKSIKEYEKVKNLKDWNLIVEFRKNGSAKRRNKVKTKARDVVRLLIENKEKLLKKISQKELMKFAINQFDSDKISPQKDKNDKMKNNPKKHKLYSGIYVFDTESRTENIHKDFCGSLYKIDVEKEECKEIATISGKDYMKTIFSYLPENSLQFIGKEENDQRTIKLPYLIYCHNLRYDFSFIKKHSEGGKKCEIIKNGGLLLQASGTFFNRDIVFRDSFGMIKEPVRKFGKIFGLEQEKEIMPYTAYNKDTIGRNYIRISTALKHLETEEEKEQFIKNIEKLDLYVGKNKKCFDHMAYCRYYCSMDVKTTALGLIKFRKMMLNVTELDIFDFISAPAISHEFFRINGCYDDCYELKGITREYIQKCVVGGRCMLNYNEKQFYEVKDLENEDEYMQDYDANSLYPSAKKEIGEKGGYIKGEPKPFINEKRTYKISLKNLNKDNISGYFIKILVKNVPKKRAFPVLSKVFDKKRNWINDFTGIQYVDKITLEDLMEFHEMEEGRDFDILEGYYFNEGRNPKILEIIQYLYNTRKMYKNEYIFYKNGEEIKRKRPTKVDENNLKLFKKECNIEVEKMNKIDPKNTYNCKKFKNPMEQIYKLLMNSAYGKTIQKPIDSSIVLVNTEEQLNNIIRVNHNRVKEAVRIKDTSKYIVTLQKSTFSHKSMPHIGCEILSMSKRIMNRVMYLAEDLGLKVYYQDTDSMHIVAKDLKKLTKEYKKKYNFEINGKDLGQFCSDFDDFEIYKKDEKTNKNIKINIKTIGSSKFIGCGKKAYFDKLTGKDPNTGNFVHDKHSRLKGIKQSIIKKSIENHKIDYKNIEQMYEGLHKGDIIEFDLAQFNNDFVAQFSYTKDFSVYTPESFKRTVKFKE